uniref:CCZ1/INTU/HSP4 first Longin domain-containing protein n=1 Tax=Anopheles melas TaxID=34690 RepID=A0A182TNW2_9DIPT
MTNPVLTAELALKSFYIFNSAFGPKEGEASWLFVLTSHPFTLSDSLQEEKKVLFYHPQDTDIDTKIKDVGLSEAIIKFSNTFTKDDSVQTMHTQKTCQFYYQPEPGYWMIMTLSVPFDRKTRDSGDYNEYHGDTIHDTIYQSVLRQAYRMFRMFHGTFQDNLRPNEELDAQANLIGRLEAFYQSYILHLQMKRCDVVDAFGSVQYLPLNQLLFLRVQNFINMIEATFAPIKHCIFLYSDQVVWSGINPTDLYTLYEYFHSPMFDQLAQSKQTRPAYVTEQGKCKRYTLMVCRKVQNISLCLLLDDGAVENEQSLGLPNDVMNLIVDLLDDVRSNRSSVMDETIVKTHDDYWIVKRSCNTRHVFIILNKSSTLIDVTEETKKILDQHCLNIIENSFSESSDTPDWLRAWICCFRLCCMRMASWSSWSHCWANPTVECSV